MEPRITRDSRGKHHSHVYISAMSCLYNHQPFAPSHLAITSSLPESQRRAHSAVVAPSPLPPIRISLLNPIINARILRKPPSAPCSCWWLGILGTFIRRHHDKIDALRTFAPWCRETRVSLLRPIRA